MAPTTKNGGNFDPNRDNLQHCGYTGDNRCLALGTYTMEIFSPKDGKTRRVNQNPEGRANYGCGSYPCKQWTADVGSGLACGYVAYTGDSLDQVGLSCDLHYICMHPYLL